METESLEIRNRMAKTEHENLSEKEERKRLQKDFDSFKEQMTFFVKTNADIQFKKKEAESKEFESQGHAEIREEHNLAEKEKKAPDILRYASKDYYIKKKEKKP